MLQFNSKKELEKALGSLRLEKPSQEILKRYFDLAMEYELNGSVFADIIYENLAKLGYIPAIDVWADILQDNERKDEDAIVFYHQATHVGHAPSARYLGEIYLQEFNKEQALCYFETAKKISKSEDVIAIERLAQIYSDFGDNDYAKLLIREIANVNIESPYIKDCPESEQIIARARANLKKTQQSSAYDKKIFKLPIYSQVYEEYFSENQITPVDSHNQIRPEGDITIGYGQMNHKTFYALHVLSNNVPHWVVAFIDENEILHIFDGNGECNNSQFSTPSYLSLGYISDVYSNIIIHSMSIQSNVGVNACAYISHFMIEFFQIISYEPSISESFQFGLVDNILEHIKNQISDSKDITPIFDPESLSKSTDLDKRLGQEELSDNGNPHNMQDDSHIPLHQIISQAPHGASIEDIHTLYQEVNGRPSNLLQMSEQHPCSCNQANLE